MRPEIMRTMIDRVFEEAPSAASFAFQGGEPTLAGLGYFRAFTEYVKSVNKTGVPVNYAIQTNGILIDDEWAAFLKENHFLLCDVPSYPSLPLSNYHHENDCNTRIFS